MSAVYNEEQELAKEAAREREQRIRRPRSRAQDGDSPVSWNLVVNISSVGVSIIAIVVCIWQYQQGQKQADQNKILSLQLDTIRMQGDMRVQEAKNELQREKDRQERERDRQEFDLKIQLAKTQSELSNAQAADGSLQEQVRKANQDLADEKSRLDRFEDENRGGDNVAPYGEISALKSLVAEERRKRDRAEADLRASHGAEAEVQKQMRQALQTSSNRQTEIYRLGHRVKEVEDAYSTVNAQLSAANAQLQAWQRFGQSLPPGSGWVWIEVRH